MVMESWYGTYYQFSVIFRVILKIVKITLITLPPENSLLSLEKYLSPISIFL